MKCGGIITAAGLSSRMGAFKPLLELNGYPMIVHTVLSMKNAGVDRYWNEEDRQDPNNGFVKGMRCIEMKLGEPDERGRRR